MLPCAGCFVGLLPVLSCTVLLLGVLTSARTMFASYGARGSIYVRLGRAAFLAGNACASEGPCKPPRSIVCRIHAMCNGLGITQQGSIV